MSRNYSFGLSLLDIIGCALGASVVLAVIFSVIRVPPPPLAPNEFILVQVTGDWQGQSGTPDNTGLVGFFVRAPNGRTLIIPPMEASIQEARAFLVDQVRLADGIELVSSWSHDLQQQSSYLSISQPSIGKWQITPYYFDFPSWLAGREIRLTPFAGVAVGYWTSSERGVVNQTTDIVPAPMQHPGIDARGNFASRMLTIDISR